MTLGFERRGQPRPRPIGRNRLVETTRRETDRVEIVGHRTAVRARREVRDEPLLGWRIERAIHEITDLSLIDVAVHVPRLG